MSRSLPPRIQMPHQGKRKSTIRSHQDFPLQILFTPDGDLQDVKPDLVDSVSGIGESLEEASQDDEEEGPKYEDFDELIDTYDETREETTLKSEIAEEAAAEEKEKDGR